MGLRDFGENYVQEFAEKRTELNDLPGAHFHLIGHLQSNKARVACELFDTIQSVDSIKLLQRLDAQAEATGKRLEILIEVKLSQEESKTGAPFSEIPELVRAGRGCSHLDVTGLMTVPPWSEDAEHSRPYFQALARLAGEHALPELSMGMSNDYEAAIEEGATIVRIGTALFGPRPKPVPSAPPTTA